MKMTVFCDVAPCSLVAGTAVLEVLAASTVTVMSGMMEVGNSSETSVNFD
jgi:hypothetical protein